MAWTSEDLATINAAIAQGAKRVRFQTHEVEYHSVGEMMRVRDAIIGEISGSNAGGLHFTEFRDGRS